MARDFYHVLIVSQSGKGKTYSFRNMDSNTTGFINVENKPLPFKNNFKYHSRPNNISEAKAALSEYAKNPEITCIVFDSFSAYLDMLLLECRATKKGFDIWNMYNGEIGKLFNFIKKIQKEVFVVVHYEWIQDEGGARERRAKVKGKEWEGLLEKEFTIVLYADRTIDPNTKKVDAWFDLALENSSSKCPPAIFGEDVFRIPNDSNFVLEKILEFVK
jgi:hypothetical protein